MGAKKNNFRGRRKVGQHIHNFFFSSFLNLKTFFNILLFKQNMKLIKIVQLYDMNLKNPEMI